ncbi:hypothetical protein FHETE_5854 [Fusarium heterosporum]|uniref:Uncharacterized protein n=1 Tax=Fusarium heterosporum TaxID=42747 RepID=A0A8H5T9M0_FUSHE|nr:hypothetical protein FHETE_5854 [Fusarium heterosporum]
MKFLSVIALLVGFSSAANIDVWDFDQSCEPYRDAIQKAYDDAHYMAVKAHKDLQVMLQPRPEYSPETLNDLKNWDRIARAVYNMFGFMPDRKGHDIKERYFSELMYVFEGMVATLQFGHMQPKETGYGADKPLMLCDRDVFQWVARDAKDPNDPTGRDLGVSQEKLLGGAPGAWHYKKRYIPEAVEKDSITLCTPGQWAVTNTRFNFIIICPHSFGEEMARTRSAVDVKDDEQTEANKLDDYSHTCLSRTMVHELTHWFGGEGDGTRNGNQRYVKDQDMVSKDGHPVYFNPKTQKFTLDGTIEGVVRKVVYDYTWVSNLARTHTGPNAGETGPDKATKTAEAYAIFAIMA